MPTPAQVVILPKETAPLRIEEVRLPDPGPGDMSRSPVSDHWALRRRCYLSRSSSAS